MSYFWSKTRVASRHKHRSSSITHGRTHWSTFWRLKCVHVAYSEWTCNCQIPLRCVRWDCAPLQGIPHHRSRHRSCPYCSDGRGDLEDRPVPVWRLWTATNWKWWISAITTEIWHSYMMTATSTTFPFSSAGGVVSTSSPFSSAGGV